jgi:aspartyl/glutamyl-tRNA(Asn/Gln) amidotransferase, C subunit
MTKLSRDDVLKLARLARIDLADDEVTEFEAEFNEILQYVEQLQAVDIEGLQPTSQVTGLTDVWREDEIMDYGYEPKDLLKNVPEVENDQIKVKRMIG